MDRQFKMPAWTESPWFKALSSVSTIITFVPIAAAFGTTWWFLVRWVMPHVNNVVVLSVASGTIFFSSLAVGLGALKLARHANATIRRWWNPPLLLAISHGGRNASIGLTHSGETTTWQVRRRIAKILYSGSNPDPFPRLCYLRRDAKSSTAMLLREGETANIVLVNPYSSEWHSRPWALILEDAEGSHGAQFNSEGAIIELEIKAVPPLKDGPLRLCFKVTRPNSGGDILIENVPCDK
jgi:hypothetical protein